MARKIDRDDYVWMGNHHFNGTVTGTNGGGDGDENVTSVNGQTGDVVLTADDINALSDDYTPDWTDVTGKPNFSSVATSGDYGDLDNTPNLGSAATADVGDFATSAQGDLAESAVQPGDLPAAPTWATISGKPSFIAEGESAAAARLSIGAGTSNLEIGTTASTALAGNTVIPAAPTWSNISGKPAFVAEGATAAAARTALGLGTAATTASTAYATAAQGSLAASAVQPSDISDVVRSEQEESVGTVITNIISMTQAEYDGLSSPSASTYYVITD